jgi:hypothetical protein
VALAWWRVVASWNSRSSSARRCCQCVTDDGARVAGGEAGSNGVICVMGGIDVAGRSCWAGVGVGKIGESTL